MLVEPSEKKTHHDDLMSDLAGRVMSLGVELSRYDQIHYWDCPHHSNLGDLLIWLGTNETLRHLDQPVKAKSTLELADVRRWPHVGTNDAIVMHGGGNFGDLYPAHQTLREQVVRNFPNNDVYLLPQSVHFSSDSAMRKSLRQLQMHDRLTIYLRDHESVQMLRPYISDRVCLMPDMAHALFSSFYSDRTLATTESGRLHLRRPRLRSIKH